MPPSCHLLLDTEQGGDAPSSFKQWPSCSVSRDAMRMYKNVASSHSERWTTQCSRPRVNAASQYEVSCCRCAKVSAVSNFKLSHIRLIVRLSLNSGIGIPSTGLLQLVERPGNMVDRVRRASQSSQNLTSKTKSCFLECRDQWFVVTRKI